MALTTAPTLAAAKVLYGERFDALALFTLHFRYELAAESFLTKLTTVAQTPDGLVFPDRMLAVAVTEEDETITLLLGGALTAKDDEEIFRKAVEKKCYVSAEGLGRSETPVIRAFNGAEKVIRAEGLFDPPKPPAKSNAVLDTIIGVGIVLAIIAAALGVLKFVFSD
ncbi:MAG: hypothetical protein ABI743_02755 [bacterium]